MSKNTISPKGAAADNAPARETCNWEFWIGWSVIVLRAHHVLAISPAKRATRKVTMHA